MTKKLENTNDYVAFEGEKFFIEWYYNKNNKSEAYEYYMAQERQIRVKLMSLFSQIANTGVIINEQKFRSEGDKIYAFKPQPHRFLCFFFKGNKIIVTNAYHKKTDKLPKNEKDKAIKNKSDYEERIKRGNYYE